MHPENGLSEVRKVVNVDDSSCLTVRRQTEPKMHAYRGFGESPI